MSSRFEMVSDPNTNYGIFSIKAAVHGKQLFKTKWKGSLNGMLTHIAAMEKPLGGEREVQLLTGYRQYGFNDV